MVDDSIEYYYSKDIDGKLIDEEIDLLNELIETEKNSKYICLYCPIYYSISGYGSEWLYELFKVLFNIDELPESEQFEGLVSMSRNQIAAGLYGTNFKISIEKFNNYLKKSFELIQCFHVSSTYIDEIFLNYMFNKEEWKKFNDDYNKITCLTYELINSETGDINHTYTPIEKKNDSYYYKKYMKYKSKYLQKKNLKM